MAERKKYNFGNAAKILANTTAQSGNMGVRAAVNGEKEIPDPKVEKKMEKLPVNGGRELASLPVQGLLRQVEMSASSVKAFNFKYVPREKLVFNEDNKYPMEDIKKLGETILRFGLIHNLEVLYDEETDTYIIESGERRTRAIDGLVERFCNTSDRNTDEYQLYLKHVKQFADEGYPCNVKRQLAAEETEMTEKERLVAQIESKIRLRIANEEVREMNAVKTRNAILELNDLYSQLNGLLNRQDRINVNEALAQEMGISTSQVKNYKATEKLIPELRELFENNSITLKEGANYAKLSEEEQRQMVTLIREGGDKKELKILSDKLSALQTEIQKKEQTIKSLEKAREQAVGQAEQERQIVAALKEKMEQDSTAVDLEVTRRQLTAAKKNLQMYEDQIKLLESEKKEYEVELERRLLEKEQQKASALSRITRMALQLDHTFHVIRESVLQYNEMLKNYEKIYDTSSGELSPEEFAGNLQKLFE